MAKGSMTTPSGLVAARRRLLPALALPLCSTNAVSVLVLVQNRQKKTAASSTPALKKMKRATGSTSGQLSLNVPHQEGPLVRTTEDEDASSDSAAPDAEVVDVDAEEQSTFAQVLASKKRMFLHDTEQNETTTGDNTTDGDNTTMGNITTGNTTGVNTTGGNTSDVTPEPTTPEPATPEPPTAAPMSTPEPPKTASAHIKVNITTAPPPPAPRTHIEIPLLEHIHDANPMYATFTEALILGDKVEPDQNCAMCQAMSGVDRFEIYADRNQMIWCAAKVKTSAYTKQEPINAKTLSVYIRWPKYKDGASCKDSLYFDAGCKDLYNNGEDKCVGEPNWAEMTEDQLTDLNSKTGFPWKSLGMALLFGMLAGALVAALLLLNRRDQAAAPATRQGARPATGRGAAPGAAAAQQRGAAATPGAAGIALNAGAVMGAGVRTSAARQSGAAQVAGMTERQSGAARSSKKSAQQALLSAEPGVAVQAGMASTPSESVAVIQGFGASIPSSIGGHISPRPPSASRPASGAVRPPSGAQQQVVAPTGAESDVMSDSSAPESSQP
ncbi:unnamed protein product [Amoebophrya sp. A120]|nr:unnamed protein product [Amoebophrya sp. A120]|eukprot:GSA120T00001934001.1